MHNVVELFNSFQAMQEGVAFPSLAEAPASEAIKTPEDLRAEWLKKRWGKFTASNFHRLMTSLNKDELPQGAKTYCMEKAVELLTDCKPDTYISPAMQWGIEHEHEAVDRFMDWLGEPVSACKDRQEFLTYGDSAGGTPDGIIESSRIGLEIKCPSSKVHFEYMCNVKNGNSLHIIAPEYYWQCQGLMMITGFPAWFFVSYDPRFVDGNMTLHTAIIERDNDSIECLQFRLDAAIEYRNRLVEKARNRVLP